VLSRIAVPTARIATLLSAATTMNHASPWTGSSCWVITHDMPSAPNRAPQVSSRSSAGSCPRLARGTAGAASRSRSGRIVIGRWLASIEMTAIRRPSRRLSGCG
jgi:hypothetical protein